MAVGCLVMPILGSCAGFEQLKSHHLCHSPRGRATAVRCALSASQDLYCWGSNERGQVGNDGYWSYYGDPQRVGKLTEVSSFAEGGHYHACAVTRAGELHCWGENTSGMVGRPVRDRLSYLDEVYQTPQRIPVPGKALAVRAGFSHTCAVTTDQRLYCWGANDQGQLGFSRDSHERRQGCEAGLGDYGSFCDQPQRLELAGVVGVALGSFHTCALTADRQVRCWGSVADGEPEDGQPLDLPAVQTIAAGAGRTCAVTTAGELFCWGTREGLLGDLGQDTYPRPTRIEGLSGVADVTVGGSHFCALTRKGEVHCQGMNDVGQLGLGDDWHHRPGCLWLRNSRCVGADVRYCHTPQKVDLSGVTTIHASENATVAETAQGIYFWGGTRGTDYEARPLKLDLD